MMSSKLEVEKNTTSFVLCFWYFSSFYLQFSLIFEFPTVPPPNSFSPYLFLSFLAFSLTTPFLSYPLLCLYLYSISSLHTFFFKIHSNIQHSSFTHTGNSDFKIGQKYPTPAPANGDRVFYESLLIQVPTRWMILFLFLFYFFLAFCYVFVFVFVYVIVFVLFLMYFFGMKLDLQLKLQLIFCLLIIFLFPKSV